MQKSPNCGHLYSKMMPEFSRSHILVRNTAVSAHFCGLNHLTPGRFIIVFHCPPDKQSI